MKLVLRQCNDHIADKKKESKCEEQSRLASRLTLFFSDQDNVFLAVYLFPHRDPPRRRERPIDRVSPTLVYAIDLYLHHNTIIVARAL